MPRAVERRADQLGHARVEHDLPAAAVADVEDTSDEPAGPRDEEPTGLDRESRRPPIRRDRVEERRAARERTGRARRRLAERTDRESAAQVERVERRLSSPRSRASERERAPDARRARHRPRPAATRHGGGCRGAGGRARPPWPTSRAAASSASVIPNLELPLPTASPACVSGVTSGLSRNRTVDRRAGRRARDAPVERGRRGPRARRPTRRRPSQRLAVGGRPDGRPQVRLGLADPLERDRRVRQPGLPARAAHSPRETTFAPTRRRPSRRRRRSPATSLALTRVLADPRIGERRRQSSAPAARVDAPSVT